MQNFKHSHYAHAFASHFCHHSIRSASDTGYFFPYLLRSRTFTKSVRTCLEKRSEQILIAGLIHRTRPLCLIRHAKALAQMCTSGHAPLNTVRTHCLHVYIQPLEHPSEGVTHVSCCDLISGACLAFFPVVSCFLRLFFALVVYWGFRPVYLLMSLIGYTLNMVCRDICRSNRLKMVNKNWEKMETNEIQWYLLSIMYLPF